MNQCSNIVTVKEDHTYWVDNVRIPGVHDVMEHMGICGGWGSKFHLDRGSAVHKAIELYEKGELDEETVDPIHVAPYLAKYREFKEKSGWISGWHEKVVYSEILRVAGTPDASGTIQEGPYKGHTLIDIKVGQPEDWHGVQLAAYDIIEDFDQTHRDEPGGRGRLGVYLRPPESTIIRHFEEKNDYKIFMSALNVLNWKLNKKYFSF
jgi:hypothetical protein